MFMKIIRAEHLGMCFGVKDAVALALETARREPLTVLGDLVHNETVVAELRAKGMRVAQRAMARLVREGFHPVVIGKRDHVEVRGMTGDLDEFDVVLGDEDVAKMSERPRFGVVAQT